MNNSGLAAERMFYELLAPISKSIRYASTEEDMFDHFDIEADGIKYDVKSHKRFHKTDKDVSNVVWLEFVNVIGKPGWLKGKADKIAFQYKEKFFIVDREKLYEWIKLEVKDLKLYHVKLYKKLYRRPRKLDVVTYVYYKDIIHLIEKVIK